MTEITNKTAFVTGAASGIGLALTKALLARGAKVMMADMNAAGLKAAQKSLNAPNDTANVVCDVSDASSVQGAAKAATQAFGNIHLVFNNAGVSLAGPPGQFNLDDWRWINNINLMGVVYGVGYGALFRDEICCRRLFRSFADGACLSRDWRVLSLSDMGQV